MVTPSQRILREMEDAYLELAAVKKRSHGARSKKRRRLRKQESLLRLQMAEQLFDLLDLQRKQECDPCA